MKILQICNYQYPCFGGIGQVAYDYAQIFNELGVDNKMICFNADAKDGDFVCHGKETIRENLKGIDLTRCGVSFTVFSQSISMTYPRELRKLLNEYVPDIVIFHYPNPYLAFFLLRNARKPFRLWVLWHSDIVNQKFLGKLFARQNLKLIKRAEKIIGTTIKHITEFDYSKEFGDKGVVVPLMVDEDRLQLTDDETQIAGKIKEKYKDKTIGFFLGRHVAYKGLKYLIEASKELDDTNIHFIIAGDGPLTPQLKELAKDDDKIEFVGQLNDSQRRIYLQACDIFCFPSITRNEAFGIALAEGMYFGKPAVTFTIKASGVNTVSLNGVTGIECPNSDSHAYAEAIRLLCNNENTMQEMGYQAYMHIYNNFTKKCMRSHISSLIQTEYSGDK